MQLHLSTAEQKERETKMKTEKIPTETLRSQFKSVFKSGRYSVWFDIYCSLRQGGDTHSEAVATIRGEIQMERMGAK